MIRRIGLCAIALMMSNQALAVEQAVELTGKAELKAKLADLHAFSAKFEQTVIDEGEILDVSTGQLTLQRPNKMRWETQTPEENLVIADGESIWNIDSFVEQVTVFPQEDAIKNNPIMLLTAKDDETWEKFSVIKLEAPSNVSAPFNTIFEVTALDTESQIVGLKLRFNDDQLVGLKTLDAQQQISDMSFTEIQENSELGEGTFTATIPDYYTVDDQR